jgi:hypothetical protein
MEISLLETVTVECAYSASISSRFGLFLYFGQIFCVDFLIIICGSLFTLVWRVRVLVI